MLDEAIVESVLVKQGIAFHDFKVEKLKGDASNRSYYRVFLSEGSMKSFIIMELAEPLAIKKAEEKLSGVQADTDELPFINILLFLEKNSIPVPKLYAYEEAPGLLFLEDVGSVTLQEHIEVSPSEKNMLVLYKQAIDHLISMQRVKEDSGCIALGRTYDAELLEWEFDHYLEYGVEYLLGVKLPASDREAIRKIFSDLSVEICRQPFVFTHRDYHSRNLMLKSGSLGIIDFQDALMGPLTYDLASLLRDSYTTLSDELISELISYYRRNAGDLSGGMDLPQFERFFDITGMQRNLKAAGRFAYIKAEKGNDSFCRYIPATLGKVGKVLAKYEDLTPLGSILRGYMDRSCA